MPETILVIDDDPAMLDFLRQRLGAEGFTVSTVASSQDGIDRAITSLPDLILLDLRMPARDGVTVCQLLRTNPKTQHIPIIIVTGALSPSHLGEVMTAGADDFVSKPIDLTDLLIRIPGHARVLGQSRIALTASRVTPRSPVRPPPSILASIRLPVKNDGGALPPGYARTANGSMSLGYRGTYMI